MKYQSNTHYDAIPMLTIGKLSAALGNISSDALRYYKRKGRIAPTAKTHWGYRLYGHDVVQRVRFIKQAQACGFTLSEIRGLLKLHQTGNMFCGDVKQLAIEKKLQISEKIRGMQALVEALDRMIAQCFDEKKGLEHYPILVALEKKDIILEYQLKKS